jgi:hypothetical protein
MGILSPARCDFLLAALNMTPTDSIIRTRHHPHASFVALTRVASGDSRSWTSVERE